MAKRDTVFSTATTTFKNTRPTGVAYDVCFLIAAKGDDPAISVNATGYTERVDISQAEDGDDQRVWCGFRTIAHTEANTVDTLTGDSEEWTGGSLRFRNVENRMPMGRGHYATTNREKRWDTLVNVASGDPVAFSVLPLMDSTIVVFFVATTDTSTAATVTDPSGTTRAWVRKDVSGNFFNSSFCAYQAYATPAATGDKTFDLNTTVATGDVITLSFVVRPDMDTQYRNQRLLTVGARQHRGSAGQIQ